MANDIVNLYAAYSIIWGGMFVYILYLRRKQENLEKDLKRLEKIVSSRETSDEE